MSLDKAIKHGKERREPYRRSARFDPSCRNHGSGHAYPCKWCEGNRLFGSIRRTTTGHTEGEEMQKELASLEALLAANYDKVRRLDDGSYIGLGKLLYTTAIYCDLDAHGYGRRYCFQSEELARDQFEKLKSADDVPTGYIARR